MIVFLHMEIGKCQSRIACKDEKRVSLQLYLQLEPQSVFLNKTFLLKVETKGNNLLIIGVLYPEKSSQILKFIKSVVG